jgi:hypothetical protein
MKNKAYFFLLLLSNILFSQNYSILLSTPSAGEELQILAEGAGNATATVVSPDGRNFTIQLENGQGRIIADIPGRWTVHVGDSEKITIASEAKIAFQQGKDEESITMAVAGFAVFIVVLIACIFYAAWQLLAKDKFNSVKGGKEKEMAHHSSPEKPAKRKLSKFRG